MEVDIHNSAQNAFVQDWLTAFMNGTTHHEDNAHIESTIEMVQELYNYKNHLKHKDHAGEPEIVATGGDMQAALRVLGKLIEIVPTDTDIADALNLSYAFINATVKINEKS